MTPFFSWLLWTNDLGGSAAYHPFSSFFYFLLVVGKRGQSTLLASHLNMQRALSGFMWTLKDVSRIFQWRVNDTKPKSVRDSPQKFTSFLWISQCADLFARANLDPSRFDSLCYELGQPQYITRSRRSECAGRCWAPSLRLQSFTKFVQACTCLI